MEDTIIIARKPRTPWTSQDDTTLQDLTEEGRTDAPIAARMDRDAKLIGKKRRALNINRGVPVDLSAMLARLGALTRTARAAWMRVAAAETILDRAYGKPTQHHELDGGDELVRRMADAAKRLKDCTG